VGAENYIIPIGNIIETMRPKREDVKKIAGGNDVINVRGEFIPVMYLANMFGTRGGVLNAAEALVVLVESGRNKIGLVVDELIGQQQVVIKTLETNSDPVEGISGATILGDGKVSLILDVGKFQQLSHQQTELVAA
jgi:two-component system chemotaxis sensor kinase CheA